MVFPDVVDVLRHKGVMAPHVFGIVNWPQAFAPEVGIWIPIDLHVPLMNINGRLLVHHDANYVLVCFADLDFLPSFREALTKASAVWEAIRCGHMGSWPLRRRWPMSSSMALVPTLFVSSSGLAYMY